jgi:hypothetical protein
VRGSTVVIDEPFCGQGGCDVLRSHAVAVSNRELLEHLNHSPRTMCAEIMKPDTRGRNRQAKVWQIPWYRSADERAK